jgi:hypothetical protein
VPVQVTSLSVNVPELGSKSMLRFEVCQQALQAAVFVLGATT